MLVDEEVIKGSSMKFAHIWMLHLLWLVPLTAMALIIHARKKKMALANFADDRLLARLKEKAHKTKKLLKYIFLLSALGLMLVALAGPRWGSHYQEVTRKGVDIMLVVDVSRSMLTEDIKPNRLERARREILDFLKVIQGDRVGMVAFSGAAFVQCPLTLDYAALEMFLGTLSPDLVPVPGTDLGAAIDTADSAFDNKSETDRVIILITDGEDNEGKGLEASRRCAEKDVKIFVFGMGNTSGGPIPAGKGKGGFLKDKKGKLVLSKLEEQGLRKIAFMSGGGYVRSVAGDLDLDTIYFDGIKSRTEARALKSGKIKVYEERFVFFVLAAFLFLILEGLINEDVRQKIRGKMKKLNLFSRQVFRILPLFLVLFGLVFQSQTLAAENPDEFYRQGRFSEAEKSYARYDMDHPKDIRYRYNRGCSAYRKSDYKGAMAAFSSVLKRSNDKQTRFKTLYNMGNSAYRQGDLESAAAYYKKSLIFNPNSKDARHNLELTLFGLDKQKKADKKKQTNKGSGQKKDNKNSKDKKKQTKDDKQGEGHNNAHQKKAPDQKSPQAKKNNISKGQPGGNQDLKDKKPEQKTTQDLSGKLKPLNALPGEKKKGQASVPAGSMLDKKKAEALLDNIKENRSRFLRLQVPEDNRVNSLSRKDW